MSSNNTRCRPDAYDGLGIHRFSPTAKPNDLCDCGSRRLGTASPRGRA